MIDESEDKVKVIPLNERIPDIEERVKYFTKTTDSFKENTTKFSRVIIPAKFSDSKEQFDWEKEEIKRCKFGHDGMSGKMYLFFNYVFIKNLSGGRIKPQFRVAANEWFQFITDCQNSKEWGVVCVKRRRVGASWMEALDVLHDIMFNTFFNVGMNSKSEKDSIELFNKVKFIYDNLPSFLRPRLGSRTGMKMEFFIKSKDQYGNPIKKGTQSMIIVSPPTDSAFEGWMLNKWVADEAGKVENLPQMWSFTEDCLMQETRRVGTPVLFGTSGEVGKTGKGLVEMWKNSDVYKLRRFFFGGWMGLDVDAFGNDNKEDSIRWILYERERRKSLSSKLYNDFIQKYPLTVEEAFSQAAGDGIGNIALINKQMSSIRENPPVAVKGKFVMNDEGVVDFKLDPVNGKVIIYEHPEENINNGYVAASDPADHDDAWEGASDLSLHIVKKRNGLERPKIVLEYVDRPSKLVDYYNQSLMAILYYKCKILVERNRYRMISHFDEMGYKHLLRLTPQGVLRMVGGRPNTIGVHMNDEMREYMCGLIEEYIDESCDLIPSYELLQECIDYGSRNTDRVYSFGLCLVLIKEDMRSLRKPKDAMKSKIPSFSFKNINGKIVRVD